MKAFKILFLGFCTFLLSCGGGEIFRDDTIFDDWFNGTSNHTSHGGGGGTTPVKTNETFFNPPNWIQGEWYNIVENSDVQCVEFTQNDFVEGVSGPSCQKYSWNYKMNDYDMWIKHEISYDSIYEVVIKNWGWECEYIFKLDEYDRLHMESRTGYKTDWDNAEFKEGTFKK
jgi:hypothetical protein